MQAPLALVGSLAALLSFRIDHRFAWLLGGLLLLLAIPFTLVAILPINKRLESRELDLQSERAGLLLRRRGRLHAVGSILSVAALVLFLVSMMWSD